MGLCEFAVLPLGVEPNLRLSEWLGFALLLPLVFGAAFQTPLVMVFLNRVGLFSVDAYRRHRRLALFLLTALAAVLTVTPDAVTMLALAVPLWGLYELGILLCRLTSRPTLTPEAEGQELLEV